MLTLRQPDSLLSSPFTTKDAAYRQRTKWALAIFLVLSLAAPAALSSPNDGNASDQPKTAPAAAQSPVPENLEVASPAAQSSEQAARELTKLIPDQKVLSGSPTTVIDLADVFADT
jgi:hypothetical protein